MSRRDTELALGWTLVVLAVGLSVWVRESTPRPNLVLVDTTAGRSL